MTSEIDVAVIGAGAAGLAAGVRLREAGASFRVLEAADHAGGRAETDIATLGSPVDLGCHWLHDALNNPFVPIARALGFALSDGSRIGTRRIHLGTRYASAAEAQEAWQAVDDAFDALHASAASGRDVAAQEVLGSRGRWDPLVRHWITFMTSKEPEEVSTRDFAAYRDSPDNWAVLDGFGALVLAHARDVPVTLSCPVTNIDRSGRKLRIETAQGTLLARAAIVTASTAVIAGGRLRFSPALPHDLAEAFEALPLGVVEKVVLAFDKDVFGVPARTSFDAFDEGAPAAGVTTVLLRPGETNGAVVHVMGDTAERLIDEGDEAMEAFAMEALARIFGSDIKAHGRGARTSRWARSPFIGGAYSIARPGAAHLRARLHDGLDGRIFFAGEALGGEAFSACHGAHLSGIAAAEAALGSLESRA